MLWHVRGTGRAGTHVLRRRFSSGRLGGVACQPGLPLASRPTASSVSGCRAASIASTYDADDDLSLDEPLNWPALAAATEEGADTLFLLFCCCHPGLTPPSQVALCATT
jgi:predicted RNA polymerase sigma factor